jgi:FtsZ-interacting cell division protein YlmF
LNGIINTPNDKDVLTFYPTAFEDCEHIISSMKRGAVVVNLENTKKNNAQRILDILVGGAVALDYFIHKIDGTTFMFLPKN